ncbi:MAG: hypothetical protein WCG10_06360 [Chlamydiota bacterium]
MHEEFKKIMDFFSLAPEEKSKHLEEVFQNSIEFFDKFKKTLQTGTPEEKSAIMKEVMELQEKLQSETTKMCAETGLSEDELKEYSHDKKHFSEDEWKSIQSAKQKFEQQAEELASVLPVPKKKEEDASAAKKTPKAKKKWVKS